MKNGQKRRYPRHKKVLFTGGIALVGLTAMLAQTDLPVKIAQSVDRTGTTATSDLPGQPTAGFNSSETAPVVEAPPPGPGPQNENGDEGHDQRDAVNPREVKDTLRGFKDLKREITRVTKDFKKVEGSGNEVRKLTELLAQVNQMESAIKAAQKSGDDDALRDALQDWYDAQVWDTVNQSRQTIQIPKEISQIGKELKKLDSLLKGKSSKKLLLDLDKLNENVNTVRAALAEAKAAYESGNLEDAESALQPIHDGMHPGEIMGVIYRMRDLSSQLGRVKDPEIKEAIDEIINPVIEAINEGDFREANTILNDYFNELMKLADMARNIGRSRTVNRSKLDKLLESLGQRMTDKFESFEQKEGGENQPG